VASIRTTELTDEICSLLAEGKSLREICRTEGMPSVGTVLRWVGEDEHLREQYTRAREMQADAYFDEIVLIADTPQRGERRTIKPDGSEEVVELDMIEHRKLRVDARKWSAARMAPKKYGDRVDVTSGGEKIAAMDETSVAARVAALVETAKKRKDDGGE
jgi:hypothetical protein